MSFKARYPKISYRKRKRSKDGQEVLTRLSSFLSAEQKRPVKILSKFWEDQQDAITHQELRTAVLQGFLNETTFKQWTEDYSYMISTQMEPIWSGAIEAGSLGQPILDPIQGTFSFDMNSPGITEWIHNRGSELVTNCTDVQRNAINYLLDEKIRLQYDPDQLAQLIRPCIGLTKPQTAAVRRFYDNYLEEQRKAHPRTKESVLMQRAKDKSLKYAERLHRQRAKTIATTELAFAYNFGADQSIRIAQDNYLIGKCIKRWNTAGDDNVCSICNSLDGVEVGMEETFSDGRTVSHETMLPPQHPLCACAIQYIEVEPPAIPEGID